MGNQRAAGAVTTLCEGVAAHRHELRTGDPILLTVVGAGFASGCVLLRWVGDDA
jgi:3-oxoacyl-[acyl-carrier-protein] synthase III